MLNSIGIIPDGNRRYAEKKGLSLLEAYQKGFQKAEEVFDWCLEIPTLKTATVYALSTENLKRKNNELKTLFSLYKVYFEKLAESAKIHENKVRVRIIGEKIPNLRKAINLVHEKTKKYKNYTLNIALGYGGRSEILNAVKRIYSEKINPEKISDNVFSKYLYQPMDINLLIRTGGMHRLSNFLPWQTVYSELYFSEKLWPEFEKKDFEKAVEFYNQTKKNFGR